MANVTMLTNSTSIFQSIGSTNVFSSSAFSEFISCKTVRLSTANGAQCDCGKLAMPAQTLAIKAHTLGEVRTIVAAGYKLAHGTPLLTITWS